MPSPDALTVAHFSDIHAALPLPRGSWRAKRLLGRVNWILRRRLAHRRSRVESAMRMVVDDPPDALLVTGDLAQLGLAAEIREAARLLAPAREAGVPVLLVSGNHDAYVEDADAAAAFAEAAASLRGDAPLLEGGVVRLGRHEIALLAQAVPTGLFRAGGRMDPASLAALERAWAGPAAGVRIAAGHFPLRTARGRRLRVWRRLRNDTALAELLGRTGAAAYCCGHLHSPHVLVLPDGVRQYCAGSISARGVVWRMRFCADGEATAEARAVEG